MMKNMTDVFRMLRSYNKKNYRLYVICTFLSTMLITAFGMMMYAPTVRQVLPEGGDSRKQVMMIFVLAAVGCLVCVIYGGSLFYRMKSREMGTLMALGTPKKVLAKRLLSEMSALCLISGAAGTMAGVGLACAIWQIFRLCIVDSRQMQLVFDYRALLIALVFLLFILLSAFIQGVLFLKRTNIMEVINESRRSEPVKEVPSWYGIAGVALVFAGAVLGYGHSGFFINLFHWYPPAIFNILYLPIFVGLYMLMLRIVVRKGSKRHPYKGIIARNMMKFQGRQTVNNMLVLTVLLAGAAFGIFYIPMMGTNLLMSTKSWEFDYQFRCRQDQDILSKVDLYGLAKEHGVTIRDYSEVPVINLARDGENFVEDDNNKYHYEYEEMLEEADFISESGYEKITGEEISIEKGCFGVIANENTASYIISRDVELITNVETGETLPVKFKEELYHEMMAGRYYVLNDEDFDRISRGLSDEWRETLVSFRVDKDKYGFANALFNEIVDHTGKECEFPDYYDRVVKMRDERETGVYWGDTKEATKISFADRDSSDFRLYWKYMPQFRELELHDFVRSLAVFLMIFLFIAIICMAAAMLIAYTRCLTIAINSKQVFDDLARLGAGPRYLFGAVREQIGKIYLVPSGIGFALMYILYLMIMYANDGSFTRNELLGVGVCLGVVFLLCGIVYAGYRYTRKKVLEILGIFTKTNTKR